METLLVFLNVQLKISLCIGNLQMLLEIISTKKKKEKERKVWAMPIPISTTKYVTCCSNGYIYHFLDYIKLLLFVNAKWMSFIMSKNVEHSSVDIAENAKGAAHGEIYKFHTSVISNHFFDQVQIFLFLRTALLLRLNSKPTVNSRTYRHLEWIRKRGSGRYIFHQLLLRDSGNH